MKISLLAAVLFIVGSLSCLNAQTTKDQSSIIFRLANHVEWPAKANAYKFIIGVMGTEADFTAFQQKALQNGSINNKAIEVRFFKCTDNIEHCDLVYVSKSCTVKMDQILKATRKEPILIVTGQEGYGQIGSVINFVESDGKVIIELNEKQASKRRLEVSATLREIAVAI